MIKIINLNKIFNQGKPNEKIALNDINLEIASGEMLAIMGASGAGKSTLLNILGCLDTPTEGVVLVNDCKLADMNDNQVAEYRRKTVGIVTQYPFLIENLSSLENVTVPLLNEKIRKTERIKRGVEMLKNLGLDDFIGKKVADMSGGERQRVTIARALINNPSIILADEPTGSLDMNNSEKIISILDKINKTGKTIIIVTHNSDIAGRCGRTITISDGKIIEDIRNNTAE